MKELTDWIRQLFEHPDLLNMGHLQSQSDLNLGYGWLYYAVARTYRCRSAVVIGSYRGFVPMVIARALQDNQDGGNVVFIDPSLVDDFWKAPEQVNAWFKGFGLGNIAHYPLTTQEFVTTRDYQGLSDIDLLFIDGLHTEEQARFDHKAFAHKLNNDSITLFHDSTATRTSRIYGEDKAYEYSVVRYIEHLKTRPDLQVFDFPLGTGLTLVRSQ